MTRRNALMNQRSTSGCQHAKRVKVHHAPLVVSAGTLFLTLLVFLVGLVGAGEPGSPTEAVKQSINEVLAVLADEELKKPERAAERRAKLEKVIGARFDYEEMGKRTLAAHWKKLDKAQQTEFVALFQQFLSNSYAGNVDGYSGEQVEYVKERLKGNYAEVQTKVVSPKVQVPLDYRLLIKNDEWRVYDVVIDGVSLMKNYRGQFSRIIKSSSYDGLFEQLRKKANHIAKPK